MPVRRACVCVSLCAPVRACPVCCLCVWCRGASVPVPVPPGGPRGAAGGRDGDWAGQADRQAGQQPGRRADSRATQRHPRHDPHRPNTKHTHTHTHTHTVGGDKQQPCGTAWRTGSRRGGVSLRSCTRTCGGSAAAQRASAASAIRATANSHSETQACSSTQVRIYTRIKGCRSSLDRLVSVCVWAASVVAAGQGAQWQSRRSRRRRRRRQAGGGAAPSHCLISVCSGRVLKALLLCARASIVRCLLPYLLTTM